MAIHVGITLAQLYSLQNLDSLFLIRAESTVVPTVNSHLQTREELD